MTNVWIQGRPVSYLVGEDEFGEIYGRTRGTIWGKHSDGDTAGVRLTNVNIGTTQWTPHTHDNKAGVQDIGLTPWGNGVTIIDYNYGIGTTKWGRYDPFEPDDSYAITSRGNPTLWGRYFPPIYDIEKTQWGTYEPNFNIGETRWGRVIIPERIIDSTTVGVVVDIGRWPNIIPLNPRNRYEYVTFGTRWGHRKYNVDIAETGWDAPSTLEKIERGYYND